MTNTATAIVARGRTVCAPHPTKKIAVGPHPQTGEMMMVAELMEYGPEQEITLPVDEIVRFRELGFLVDQNKIIPSGSETWRDPSAAPSMVAHDSRRKL